MKTPTVYIETSVISYLTNRPSGDLLVAAHQKATQDWWANCSGQFELWVSPFVMSEAGGGNAEASARRLGKLIDIPQLETPPSVDVLAQALLADGALPAKARLDALHIAVAAVHQIDYLLTWNFKHIANAEKWAHIRRICQTMGFQMPVICSPLELMQD